MLIVFWLSSAGEQCIVEGGNFHNARIGKGFVVCLGFAESVDESIPIIPMTKAALTRGMGANALESCR